MPDKKKHKPRPDLDERGLKWLEERHTEVEHARKRLEAKAKKLGVRIEDLRDDRQAAQDRARDKAKTEKELEKAIEKARRDDLWDTRACVDGATTWLGLKLVLNTVEVKTAWAGGANALDRTDHADDCGDKMSQAELYYGYVNGLPGFAPANPPGTGTHEGIADATFARVLGVAVGSKLPAWAWGMDLSDGPGFEAGAEQLGFKVVRPYGNEAWHCNLTENPTDTLRKLGVI